MSLRERIGNVRMFWIAETEKRVQEWGGRVALCRVKGVVVKGAFEWLAGRIRVFYLVRVF